MQERACVPALKAIDFRLGVLPHPVRHRFRRRALYVPVDGQGGTYAGNQPVFTAFAGNFAGNGGVANLDGSFNLQGGEKPEGTLQTVLRWQSAAAINPPSTQTPK